MTADKRNVRRIVRDTLERMEGSTAQAKADAVLNLMAVRGALKPCQANWRSHWTPTPDHQHRCTYYVGHAGHHVCNVRGCVSWRDEDAVWDWNAAQVR